MNVICLKSYILPTYQSVLLCQIKWKMCVGNSNVQGCNKKIVLALFYVILSKCSNLG